ncbi:MAG TPA: TonB family protein [Campylobacterales bacterium]|nr:TonB family protein [Campylobacterales bacterium]
MSFIKERLSLAVLISAMLHSLIFGCIYVLNLDAKTPLPAKNDAPISVNLLEDSPKEVAHEKRQQEIPKKQSIKKQEQKPKQIAKAETMESVKSVQSQSTSAVEAKTEQQPKEHKVAAVQTLQPQPENSDEIKKYLSKIKKKLQDNLEYPHFAKKAGMEGVTTVCFWLRNDGRLVEGSLKVVQSSGYSVLDRQALVTVEDSAPFSLPPKEGMKIVIGIEFKSLS